MIPTWLVMLNFTACVLTIWVLAFKYADRIYKKALKEGKTTSSRWTYMHAERQQNYLYPEFFKVMSRPRRSLLLTWFAASFILLLGHDLVKG